MTKRVTRIADVLKAKESVVHTIKPTETLEMLSKRLRQEQVGVMVVSEDGRSVAGIISERDLAYGLAAYKAELHTMPVSALMTKKVVTCTPEDELADVVKIMMERHIRHLPVVDAGRLVGVVGMRDAMIYRVHDMQRTARLISSAIAGD